MASDSRWLVDGNGTVWLAWSHVVSLQVGPWTGDGVIEEKLVTDSLLAGWDTAVDSEGNVWVTWSEEGPVGAVVFVQRHADGAWGPRLQLSTVGTNLDPIIAPDEYGNVWIFWERWTEGRDIVMCRMGPRSGQETLVARNAGQPRSAVTRRGVIYVTYGEPDVYAVTGAEHGGFGEPVRIATD